MTAKPNVNVAWAEGGTKTDPGSAKYTQGWGAEIPTYQDFNFILNRTDTFQKHVNEHGITQWDATTSYPQHGVVLASNGRIYQSLSSSNQNNDPTSTPANWVDITEQFVTAGYAEASGTDTYTATISYPANLSLQAGQRFYIKISNDNTVSEPTININGTGAKNIVLNSGSELSPGELKAGMIAILEYDGTNMQLANPVTSSTANMAPTYHAVASGTNTYTATMTDPQITEYIAGRVYKIGFQNANTSEDVTLNINSIGAKTVKLFGGSKPKIGDIIVGMTGEFIYDGTSTFYLMNPYLSETFYAETSGTDTYTATMTDPKITEYKSGRVYMINFINASTSEDVTLNINSIGAKPVLLTDASKPQIGDIKPHHRTRLIYDGTNFLMLDPYLNTKHAGIASSLATSGYTRTRDGFIVQWGRAAISNGSNTGHADITFPIAFPKSLFSITTSYDRQPSSTYGGFHTGAFNQSQTGCRLYGDLGASGTIDQPVQITYIAMGN